MEGAPINSENQKLIFLSQAQCSEILGLPLSVLRKAKAHPDSIKGENGMKRNGNIDGSKLIPWLEKHKEELQAEDEGDTETLTYWKTVLTEAKAKRELILLKEDERNSLNKEDVKTFLRKVSTAQAAVLKSKLTQELPPKLLGLSVTEMSVVMEQTVKDVCELFQKEADKWQ